MTRDECWMTFTEALESFLDNRDNLRDARGRNNKFDIEVAESRIEQARDHLEAYMEGR